MTITHAPQNTTILGNYTESNSTNALCKTPITVQVHWCAPKGFYHFGDRDLLQLWAIHLQTQFLRCDERFLHTPH